MKKKIFLLLFICVIFSLFFILWNDSKEQHYFEDGALKTEYSLDRKGKLKGTYSNYSREGQKEFVLNYKDGVLFGKQKYFYPSGNLKEIFTVINGCREEFKKFNDNGILLAEGQFNQNMNRFGLWKYYNEAEHLTATGIYNTRGLKKGIWKYFKDEISIEEVDWIIYNQTSENFSLNLPRTWQVKDKQSELLLLAYLPISSGADKRAISLSIVKLENDISKEGTSLREIYMLNLDELKKEFSGEQFDMKMMDEITINGNPALRSLFTVSYANGGRGFYQFLVKKQTSLYLLTFVSFEKDLKDYLRRYDEIAYSFR